LVGSKWSWTGSKKLDLPVKEKVMLIKRENKKIRVTKQMQLLGIARSTVYYKPAIDEYNLKLMDLIDEQYTRSILFTTHIIIPEQKDRGYLKEYKILSK